MVTAGAATVVALCAAITIGRCLVASVRMGLSGSVIVVVVIGLHGLRQDMVIVMMKARGPGGEDRLVRPGRVLARRSDTRHRLERIGPDGEDHEEFLQRRHRVSVPCGVDSA